MKKIFMISLSFLLFASPAWAVQKYLVDDNNIVVAAVIYEDGKIAKILKTVNVFRRGDPVPTACYPFRGEYVIKVDMETGLIQPSGDGDVIFVYQFVEDYYDPPFRIMLDSPEAVAGMAGICRYNAEASAILRSFFEQFGWYTNDNGGN